MAADTNPSMLIDAIADELQSEGLGADLGRCGWDPIRRLVDGLPGEQQRGLAKILERATADTDDIAIQTRNVVLSSDPRRAMPGLYDEYEWIDADGAKAIIEITAATVDLLQGELDALQEVDPDVARIRGILDELERLIAPMLDEHGELRTESGERAESLVFSMDSDDSNFADLAGWRDEDFDGYGTWAASSEGRMTLAGDHPPFLEFLHLVRDYVDAHVHTSFEDSPYLICGGFVLDHGRIRKASLVRESVADGVPQQLTATIHDDGSETVMS